MPLVLLVVLLTLIALLRAIVAPLYLIGSVILSFFGVFGASLVFFTHRARRDRLRAGLPLFALHLPGGARGRLQHLPHGPRP